MSGSPQKLSEVYSDETCQALAIAYLAWKKENQLASGYFSLTLDNLVSCLKTCRGAVKIWKMDYKMTGSSEYWTLYVQYSGDLKSNHLKTGNVQNMYFLKVGFQMVQFVNGRFLAMSMVAQILRSSNCSLSHIQIVHHLCTWPVFKLWSIYCTAIWILDIWILDNKFCYSYVSIIKMFVI